MDIETGSAESATIVGTILQSFAFASYSLLFSTSLYILRKHIRGSTVLFSGLIALYGLILVHVGLSVYDTYQAFVVHRHDEGGIAAWIARNHNYLHPVQDIIFYLTAMLSDAVMIGRVYEVYENSLWACTPPLLALFTATGFGAIDIAIQFLQAKSSGDKYTGMDIPWHGVAIGANLFTSLVITVMIAGKHWYHGRVGVETPNSWYDKPLRLLSVYADSGALYPTVLVVVSFCYAADLANVLWVASFILPSTLGINATLMLVNDFYCPIIEPAPEPSPVIPSLNYRIDRRGRRAMEVDMEKQDWREKYSTRGW